MTRRLVAAGAVAVLVLVGVFLGSALSQFGAVPGSGRPSGMAGAADDGPRIRVEVLNGGGVPGAAGTATDLLRDHGFDVVYFGNAATFDHDSSRVLDRVGAVDRARAVADALGIRTVRSEPDSNLFLDVSVVLGTDWAPASPAEAATDSLGPWWDPRRWLRR
ncbi:MAG: LytR C-terminal domain-containing protein [Longimicrobiales bacterium]